MANKGKESFILYTSYKEKFEDLSDEQFGKLIRLMIKNATNEEIGKIEDKQLRLAFKVVKVEMDANAEKYDKACKKKQEAQERRWKKQAEDKKEIEHYRELYKNIDNYSKNSDNDNENENENENENDNVTHSVCVNNNNNNNAHTRESDANFKIYGLCGNVKLTDKEMKELAKKYPELYSDYIERLSLHKGSAGREYESDFATIMKWIRQDESKEKEKGKSKRKEDCINDRSEYGNSDGLYESFATALDDAKK